MLTVMFHESQPLNPIQSHLNCLCDQTSCYCETIFHTVLSLNRLARH